MKLFIHSQVSMATPLEVSEWVINFIQHFKRSPRILQLCTAEELQSHVIVIYHSLRNLWYIKNNVSFRIPQLVQNKGIISQTDEFMIIWLQIANTHPWQTKSIRSYHSSHINMVISYILHFQQWQNSVIKNAFFEFSWSHFKKFSFEELLQVGDTSSP